MRYATRLFGVYFTVSERLCSCTTGYDKITTHPPKNHIVRNYRQTDHAKSNDTTDDILRPVAQLQSQNHIQLMSHIVHSQNY